jgi:signal transduction histidine kinase
VVHVVIAALTPVVAVALGAGAAARAMFVSGHDADVLLIVLIASATVAVLEAVVLGRLVGRAGRSLGAMVRGLGEGAFAAPPVAFAPSELALLAAELEATSVRLAEAQEQAAALERSRRELVAWVSHDLRTPLSGIKAMVEALEDEVVTDPATVARYHRTMRQEADRLAGLVDDLFELSRIEAGALALEPRPVALDELLSDALAGVSVAAAAKGVELHGDVPHPSPLVELSIPEVARVVRNLLDNAIRHTPAGGAVRLDARTEPATGCAIVSVHDGCGGIPDRDIDHVFDLAFRGDAARTPGDAGAGLGLAVARGLVEAHRGEITVRNEDGGCRFTVRLPLRQAVGRKAR